MSSEISLIDSWAGSALRREYVQTPNRSPKTHRTRPTYSGHKPLAPRMVTVPSRNDLGNWSAASLPLLPPDEGAVPQPASSSTASVPMIAMTRRVVGLIDLSSTYGRRTTSTGQGHGTTSFDRTKQGGTGSAASDDVIVH